MAVKTTCSCQYVYARHISSFSRGMETGIPLLVAIGAHLSPSFPQVVQEIATPSFPRSPHGEDWAAV